MEFFHNATELRREITLLLLRDFGVKDKVRTVKSLYGISNMEPEDTKKNSGNGREVWYVWKHRGGIPDVAH